MNLEDEYSYQSFIKTWNNEKDGLTPHEINQLVKELARAYYLALSEGDELANRCQVRLLEGT